MGGRRRRSPRSPATRHAGRTWSSSSPYRDEGRGTQGRQLPVSRLSSSQYRCCAAGTPHSASMPRTISQKGKLDRSRRCRALMDASARPNTRASTDAFRSPSRSTATFAYRCASSRSAFSRFSFSSCPLNVACRCSGRSPSPASLRETQRGGKWCCYEGAATFRRSKATSKQVGPLAPACLTRTPWASPTPARRPACKRWTPAPRPAPPCSPTGSRWPPGPGP